MSFKRLLILACVPLLATACRSTVTQSELDSIVAETQGNTFPGKLIHEKQSPRYDYYHIETELGIYGRYQVLKKEAASGAIR